MFLALNLVEAIYGPAQLSLYQISSEWTVLIQENQDDAYVRIPDFGFDFVWDGVNYRSATYIGSNGYVTGHGSNSYSIQLCFRPHRLQESKTVDN